MDLNQKGLGRSRDFQGQKRAIECACLPERMWEPRLDPAFHPIIAILEATLFAYYVNDPGQASANNLHTDLYGSTNCAWTDSVAPLGYAQVKPLFEVVCLFIGSQGDLMVALPTLSQSVSLGITAVWFCISIASFRDIKQCSNLRRETAVSNDLAVKAARTISSDAQVIDLLSLRGVRWASHPVSCAKGVLWGVDPAFSPSCICCHFIPHLALKAKRGDLHNQESAACKACM